METDLIDLLIIDEASQVSIADSISLMLRAKQTIVFGDELQYGAVGAFNVSRVYSEAYFREILGAYAERSQQTIPDEEMERLSREANESQGEEEETASQVLPVDPGTREWLKTFSVRTSTLAFAKALQNYSASLNTHFAGYGGSIGVICSFKQQTQRMREILRERMDLYPRLEGDHNFRVWFVGDVQGEERDTVYYSLVQDKKIGNADLRQIYPTIGGTADDIRKLKMQRLNVGFSRAKDHMVFVHSMEIGDYSDTRLGDALRHYRELADQTHDHYIEDETVFDSPAERQLYQQITQTHFFQENRERLRLIAQFEIGRYIRREYRKYIPAYRVDFLMTLTSEAPTPVAVLDRKLREVFGIS